MSCDRHALVVIFPETDRDRSRQDAALSVTESCFFQTRTFLILTICLGHCYGYVASGLECGQSVLA